MLFWARFPFVRITILFGLGIWVGDCIALPGPTPFIVWILSFLLFAFASRYFVKRKFRNFNLTLSILAFSMIFLTGYLLMYLNKVQKTQVEETIRSIPVAYYLARVSLSAGETGPYQKIIAEIDLIFSEGEPVPVHGKILLYLPREAPLIYGDQLLVRGRPDSFREPVFPDEFNYKKYMWRKGILFQHFLSENHFIHIPDEGIHFPGKVAYQFREEVIRKIKKRIHDPQVQALMIALTTGKRDYFDEETYDQFVGAGIVHILAVSGLHVGILYLLLIRLTQFLSFHLAGRRIRLILILNFFFFFAFLTGLTPSVLRSVVMFSVMLLGLTFDRKSPIMNSVFLSAFLLLSCNPELLWQVGFQLSYSAVIGILLFHPVFHSMWQPKYRFIQGCWNLITVSISAQLATLPLSLYYFKQFPTYFIVSNLIAIPFATLFVPGCLLFLATYFLIPVNQWIASLMDNAGQLFIWLIGFVHELPGSLISPVVISTFDFLIIFMMISLLYLLLRFRKSWLSGSILFLLGFLVMKSLWVYHATRNKKEILTYTIAGSPVLELITGNESIIVVDTLNRSLSEKIEYHTGSFHRQNYLECRYTTFENLHQYVPTIKKKDIMLICWNGKSLFISGSEENPGPQSTIQTRPDFTLTKYRHQYVLGNPETESIRKEESLNDRLFSITRKKECPEIEISPGKVHISF